MSLRNKNLRLDKTCGISSILRFISHHPVEAFLCLRMAAWVTWLSLFIKFAPLPRVLSIISVSPRGKKPVYQVLTQQRLARLVDAVLELNILCFTPTCWKRAPILHRYLGLSGIETRIVFGVRKEEGALLAGHAWLEADNQPLLESLPPQFIPTYSFPV